MKNASKALLKKESHAVVTATVVVSLTADVGHAQYLKGMTNKHTLADRVTFGGSMSRCAGLTQ